MHYSIPEDPMAGPCCRIGCDKPATWNLEFGDAIEDSTMSCDDDVAHLLGDKPLLSIFRIQPIQVEHLEVLFDGPPGPTSGRFVELEGVYGVNGSRRGGIGVRHPEAPERSPHWVEDGDYWKLRIPVHAGWIVG